MGSKTKQFFGTSSAYDYNIITLTETWLKSNIANAELFDDSYTVYRNDRDTRGGGVLIALKNEIFASEQIVIPNTDNLEYVCIKATTGSHCMYVYNAYIPPVSSAEIYSSHLAAIHSIATDPEDVLIIVGDFNLPHVQWTMDDDVISIPTAFESQHASDFITGLLDLGVYQVNSIRNSKDRLLDLFFTNDFTNISIDHAKPLSRVDEYHPPILATFEWHTAMSDTTSQPTKTFNWKRANFTAMNEHLANVDFAALFDGKSLTEKVSSLHSVLNDAVKKYIPPVIVRRRTKLPWNNKKLQNLKNRKNKAWKRFKVTGDKHQFDKAFEKFDGLNTALYNGYVDKLKLSLKSDPSSFWRFVNSKKSTDNQPKVLHLNSNRSSDEKVQADMFAEFFSSNYTVSSAQNSSDQSTNDNARPRQFNFSLDQNFVLEGLQSINVKKGVGPDGVHPLILKRCAKLLAAPLTELFNESLSSGVFPNQWKKSSVTPIFKKGARSNIQNYRCIAKLQTIAKFFEFLVNVKLLELVNDKLTRNQHGFMRSRSTASNLAEFIYFAQKCLNSGHQVDVLYTDFSKAFDRVNHKKLIRKLRAFNLPYNLVSWLESYLLDRTQYVNYGNSASYEFTCTSGVPQGSHLGPTLFLLFINDIVEGMDDVFISLYADDVKIAKAVSSAQDAATLQAAIDKLRNWCNENDLHLNLDKCAVLTIDNRRNIIESNYTYGDHIFKRVADQKDLGVIIDNKLKFAKHIAAITSKATAALGFIKRFCYDISDAQTLKTLYYALVQSHLEYCSIVWLPFDKIYKDKIESILKQFTMFARKEYPSASNGFQITSYYNRLKALDMVSLDRRRINSSVIFMYDLLHDLTNCQSIRNDVAVNDRSRDLRNTEFVKIIDKKMKLSLKSPLAQTCKFSNKVADIFAKSISRNNFITLLRAVPNVFV